MPQEFHIVRCYKCETFQVQIVKKLPKWECKICGEKQSVRKVYGKGTSRDCRSLVQKLNALRAEIITDDTELLPVEGDDTVNINHEKNFSTSTSTTKKNKWHEFLNEEELRNEGISDNESYGVRELASGRKSSLENVVFNKLKSTKLPENNENNNTPLKQSKLTQFVTRNTISPTKITDTVNVMHKNICAVSKPTTNKWYEFLHKEELRTEINDDEQSCIINKSPTRKKTSLEKCFSSESKSFELSEDMGDKIRMENENITHFAANDLLSSVKTENKTNIKDTKVPTVSITNRNKWYDFLDEKELKTEVNGGNKSSDIKTSKKNKWFEFLDESELRKEDVHEYFDMNKTVVERNNLENYFPHKLQSLKLPEANENEVQIKKAKVINIDNKTSSAKLSNNRTCDLVLNSNSDIDELPKPSTSTNNCFKKSIFDLSENVDISFDF